MQCTEISRFFLLKSTSQGLSVFFRCLVLSGFLFLFSPSFAEDLALADGESEYERNSLPAGSVSLVIGRAFMVSDAGG